MTSSRESPLRKAPVPNPFLTTGRSMFLAEDVVANLGDEAPIRHINWIARERQWIVRINDKRIGSSPHKIEAARMLDRLIARQEATHD